MPLPTGNTSLIYLAPGDVLKGRVEPTIWMRMCQGFGDLGLDVELVSLYTFRRENIKRSEIFDHYGIKHPSFSLQILPTPLTVRSSVAWSRICTVAANFLHALRRLRRLRHSTRRRNVLIYSRGPAAIYPYLGLRRVLDRYADVLCVFETHALPTGRLAIDVTRKADGVVVSSLRLVHDMETRLGIPANRLQQAYLASNAVAVDLDRDEARRRLGLPLDRRCIIYTGKLVMREVLGLLDTAEQLSVSLPDVDLVFVGGNPQVLRECGDHVRRRRLKNVQFIGFVPPARVALYQSAADALVLYLMKDREIIDYITPSKVFDYLQAGRPIIVSDFPILHEMLEHDQNAVFVPPESPGDFAHAIQRVLQDPALSQRLGSNARRCSFKYSWSKRVQLITDFMQRLYTLKPDGSSVLAEVA